MWCGDGLDDEERGRGIRVSLVTIIVVYNHPAFSGQFSMSAWRSSRVGWSLRLALFLAISLLVQPVHPNGAKGRGAFQPELGEYG